MIRSQAMAPEQPAEDHVGVDDARVDQALADRLGDGGADHERGDEIEERRPEDRHPGGEYPGRHDRGDRVGAVVKAVDEIEDQRDGTMTRTTRTVPSMLRRA